MRLRSAFPSAALLLATGIAVTAPGEAPAGTSFENQQLAHADNYDKMLFRVGYYKKVIIKDPGLVAFYASTLIRGEMRVKPNCVILYLKATKETDDLHRNLQGCREVDLEAPAQLKDGKLSAGQDQRSNPRCLGLQFVDMRTQWDTFSAGYTMADTLGLINYLEARDMPTDYLPPAKDMEQFEWCQHVPRAKPPVAAPGSPGT